MDMAEGERWDLGGRSSLIEDSTDDQIRDIKNMSGLLQQQGGSLHLAWELYPELFETPEFRAISNIVRERYPDWNPGRGEVPTAFAGEAVPLCQKIAWQVERLGLQNILRRAAEAADRAQRIKDWPSVYKFASAYLPNTRRDQAVIAAEHVLDDLRAKLAVGDADAAREVFEVYRYSTAKRTQQDFHNAFTVLTKDQQLHKSGQLMVMLKQAFEHTEISPTDEMREFVVRDFTERVANARQMSQAGGYRQRLLQKLLDEANEFVAAGLLPIDAAVVEELTGSDKQQK